MTDKKNESGVLRIKPEDINCESGYCYFSNAMGELHYCGRKDLQEKDLPKELLYAYHHTWSACGYSPAYLARLNGTYGVSLELEYEHDIAAAYFRKQGDDLKDLLFKKAEKVKKDYPGFEVLFIEDEDRTTIAVFLRWDEDERVMNDIDDYLEHIAWKDPKAGKPGSNHYIWADGNGYAGVFFFDKEKSTLAHPVYEVSFAGTSEDGWWLWDFTAPAKDVLKEGFFDKIMDEDSEEYEEYYSRGVSTGSWDTVDDLLKSSEGSFLCRNDDASILKLLEMFLKLKEDGAITKEDVNVLAKCCEGGKNAV